ncbi:hypothetical protein WN982_19165 [Paraburkholderia sp. IMGN_8]|uniref:hypothetical protein n=1 Tax=Paraburkholderia sp. IMGN_8 TaxID=3136564 RepID=UPI00310186C9
MIVYVTGVRQLTDQRNAIRLILAKSLLRNLFNTKFISTPSKRSLDFQHLNKFEETISSTDRHESPTAVKG